jgi:1-acyl-sn-glycerol-3-phosphate acyltransferase
MRALYNFAHCIFVPLAAPWFSVRVENRPPLESMGPVILAPNHASFIDPPVLQRACGTHVTFLMTETIYRARWFSWLFRIWGTIPVPENGSAAGAIKAALRAIRDGRQVVIFPEGRVSDDGCLGEGRGGVAVLLAKARVPVIPVAILGTYEVLPRHGRRLRRHPVVVRFGDPIPPVEDLDRDQVPAFAAKVMDAIAALGAPRREASSQEPATSHTGSVP